MSSILITNAYEGNLKNISLEIPKNKFVVFTGVSGSGKSTLLIDVLYNECQRQYLEAMAFQGIQKPKVERVQGASPAIVISQNYNNKNPRSTVGTMTDIYTDLRMVYEKLGVRVCPYCGEIISSADCREETEKIGSDFFVYMYCHKCGKKMDKITRTYFSFNTKEGACPICQGLGRVHTIRETEVIDESLSLEDGAVRYWEKQYGKYQISVLYKAFAYYGISIPENIPVAQFCDVQKAILYEGTESEKIKELLPDMKPPKTASAGRFEGVYPILWRRLAEKNGDMKQLEAYFDVVECPDCKGERLCELSRSVTVDGVRLPEISRFSLEKLYDWVRKLHLSLSVQMESLAGPYLLDMETKLNRFLSVGLGYLSLDRQILTLSGGEIQRMRLAAALDSTLSGIVYILDEPTAGLHPKDTGGLIKILRNLRDLGNTVLVIEHDIDVMEAADYMIDMGPGAGKSGGEITASGTMEELKKNPASVTGAWFAAPHPDKKIFRKATETLCIENADKFNLKHISVEIPTGCLVSVTGPSGSGKSTLVFEVLAKGGPDLLNNRVSGMEQFDKIVEIGQSGVTKMRRSNVATYIEIYTEIRTLFSRTEGAKRAGFTAKHFSFNTPGGRCENCAGLGVVENNMLFFADTEVVCPVCNGNQFRPEILDVRYQGLSIKDVLKLSVEEAADFFMEDKNMKKRELKGKRSVKEIEKINRILSLLKDVGLSYLELGQTLTTLSGGEEQRLKLARELLDTSPDKKNLYLLDEPTVGLHPRDVEHFLALLNRMVDRGNSVIVVEHNQQVIRDSDWVIDLGPEGGDKGGMVMYTGTPGI